MRTVRPSLPAAVWAARFGTLCALAVISLVQTGCSLGRFSVEIGPSSAPPLPPAEAPPAAEQKAGDKKGGKNGKKNASGSSCPNCDRGSDKDGDKNGSKKGEKNGEGAKPPRIPPPRTLPQALRRYFRCLCGDPAAQPPPAAPPPPETKSTPVEENNRSNGANGSSENQEQGAQGPPAGKTPPQNGAGGKDKPGGKNGDEKKENKEDNKEKDKEKSEEKEQETQTWYSAHAQGTVVTQEHFTFHSPYSGPLSLQGPQEAATSETTTLFFAARLWDGGEFVFNPEVAGGRGLSGSNGVAGFPNGEITRVGIIEPTPYIARAFLRQTFCLGDETEKVEDGINLVAGSRSVERLTVSIGKFSTTDYIDDNRYSHDPRISFLNWGLMYNVAWDYPANVRGYTYGMAVDFNQKNWALHYVVAAEPAIANGAPIDPRFLKANGHILEWEERYKLNEHPGKLRLWVYGNHAHMGKYAEALEEMPVNPNVTQTRAYRWKYGLGGNVEQEITKELGTFVKVGWNDGHSESWAFTAVDSTLALGAVLRGRCWCRPNDVFGLAYLMNGISPIHRQYLAAGGLDFNIGDGRLNYGLEKILESFYNLQIHKGIFVTLDYQLVTNPAYNRDRGPVSILAGRFHIEF